MHVQHVPLLPPSFRAPPPLTHTPVQQTSFPSAFSKVAGARREANFARCSVAVYRERLIAIYQQHKPDNVEKVDYLLNKYHDNEEYLYMLVCTKYSINPEPLPSVPLLPVKSKATSLTPCARWTGPATTPMTLETPMTPLAPMTPTPAGLGMAPMTPAVYEPLQFSGLACSSHAPAPLMPMMPLDFAPQGHVGVEARACAHHTPGTYRAHGTEQLTAAENEAAARSAALACQEAIVVGSDSDRDEYDPFTDHITVQRGVNLESAMPDIDKLLLGELSNFFVDEGSLPVMVPVAERPEQVVKSTLVEQTVTSPVATSMAPVTDPVAGLVHELMHDPREARVPEKTGDWAVADSLVRFSVEREAAREDTRGHPSASVSPSVNRETVPAVDEELVTVIDQVGCIVAGVPRVSSDAPKLSVEVSLVNGGLDVHALTSPTEIRSFEERVASEVRTSEVAPFLAASTSATSEVEPEKPVGVSTEVERAETATAPVCAIEGVTSVPSLPEGHTAVNECVGETLEVAKSATDLAFDAFEDLGDFVDGPEAAVDPYLLACTSDHEDECPQVSGLG